VENQPNNQEENKVEYLTIKYTVGWLPSSIALTEQSKAVLAREQGVDSKVLRGSYAILGASNDDLIKEGTNLRRLLGIIRDEYTIPEYTLVGTAADTENLKPEKVPGSHLIEAAKLDEFLTRFNAARDQYLDWGKRVSSEENYNKIKESDKIKLGKDWVVVERKYPTSQELADAITCDVPRIEPYNATFTIANLAPATSEKIRKQAEQRLEASVNGAVGELVYELKEMVATVARNCGKRIRLIPGLDNPYYNLRDAEVREIIRHSDNDEIPAGYVQIIAQECVPAGKNGFKQVGKEKSLLLTEQEYLELKPYETDEYKSLTQSGFSNLQWLAQKIASVQNMLGEEGKPVIDLAKEVQDALSNMGNSADSITREIKNSGFARKSAHTTFNNLLQKISTQEIEIRKIQKVGRKIDKACA
jgi:hypothetical protein